MADGKGVDWQKAPHMILSATGSKKAPNAVVRPSCARHRRQLVRPIHHIGPLGIQVNSTNDSRPHLSGEVSVEPVCDGGKGEHDGAEDWRVFPLVQPQVDEHGDQYQAQQRQDGRQGEQRLRLQAGLGLAGFVAVVVTPPVQPLRQCLLERGKADDR
eukprot:scaffold354208_cov25-Prasinocladus_malaysianus.AAC.1